MRVLVTGGTGYLGGAIVRAFERHGHTPLVFARRATAAVAAGTPVAGDIRDRTAVFDAVRKADAVCHSAALVSGWSRRLQDFDEVNVGGLQNVLDAAQAGGVTKVVYTSSFLAMPPADQPAVLAGNDYQRTKAAARRVARAAAQRGLPIVTMVPGVVYGPGASTEGNLVGKMVRDHLAGRLPGVLGGDRIWSFAWIDDVADAHVMALERAPAGSEYQVGGENVPQVRLFEIVRELTGRPLPRRIPFLVANALALVDATRARIFGASPQLTPGTVEILRHDWPLDSTRSIDELGYRITPLADGVRTLLTSIT